MKINLTVSERVATMAIMNAFKGNLETMAPLLEDIKAIVVQKEDWEKAERVETLLAGGGKQWNWDDEKGGEKEVELQKPTLDYVIDAIKQKSEKGEITFQDKALLSLNQKLNA